MQTAFPYLLYWTSRLFSSLILCRARCTTVEPSLPRIKLQKICSVIRTCVLSEHCSHSHWPDRRYIFHRSGCTHGAHCKHTAEGQTNKHTHKTQWLGLPVMSHMLYKSRSPLVSRSSHLDFWIWGRLTSNLQKAFAVWEKRKPAPLSFLGHE